MFSENFHGVFLFYIFPPTLPPCVHLWLIAVKREELIVIDPGCFDSSAIICFHLFFPQLSTNRLIGKMEKVLRFKLSSLTVSKFLQNWQKILTSLSIKNDRVICPFEKVSSHACIFEHLQRTANYKFTTEGQRDETFTFELKITEGHVWDAKTKSDRFSECKQIVWNRRPKLFVSSNAALNGQRMKSSCAKLASIWNH